MIFVGILLTAIGGVGSHLSGERENKQKEKKFNTRIEELQNALVISIEQNSELTNKFT
jgi:hypothetical protein